MLKSDQETEDIDDSDEVGSLSLSATHPNRSTTTVLFTSHCGNMWASASDIYLCLVAMATWSTRGRRRWVLNSLSHVGLQENKYQNKTASCPC